MNAVRYLQRRLEERTTWAAIGIAVTGGAALAAPYSWILIGCGIAGVLVPSPHGGRAVNGAGDGDGEAEGAR